jgi:tellurite resistance protein
VSAENGLDLDLRQWEDIGAAPVLVCVLIGMSDGELTEAEEDAFFERWSTRLQAISISENADDQKRFQWAVREAGLGINRLAKQPILKLQSRLESTIALIYRHLSEEVAQTFRDALLQIARDVASASGGGALGLRNPINPAEYGQLAQLEGLLLRSVGSAQSGSSQLIPHEDALSLSMRHWEVLGAAPVLVCVLVGQSDGDLTEAEEDAFFDRWSARLQAIVFSPDPHDQEMFRRGLRDAGLQIRSLTREPAAQLKGDLVTAIDILKQHVPEEVATPFRAALQQIARDVSKASGSGVFGQSDPVNRDEKQTIRELDHIILGSTL